MNSVKITLLLAISLLMSCKATESVVGAQNSSSAEEKIVSNDSGYFEMGLIEYEIIDTAEMSQETAEVMVDMLSSSVEGIYVYNKFSGAQVTFSQSDSSTYKVEHFDNKSNRFIQFLYSSGESYMFEQDLVAMAAEMPEPTAEELEQFQSLFKREENIDKEIFGFKCDKVKMYEPSNLTTPMTVSFMTREIPFMSNSFGIIGEIMGGFPIYLESNMNGLKIIMGALSHNLGNRYANYLEHDETQFIKIDEIGFATKEQELMR